MKIVLIEWEDSSSYGGWHRVMPELDSISNCISIGILCQDSPKYVVLSQSKSDSGNYGDTISIPKSCIKRIRYLKVK